MNINDFSTHSVWIHKESSDLYTIKCVANLHSTKPGFVPTVVYQNAKTGEIWSRPYHEFIEKFQPCSGVNLPFFTVADCRVSTYMHKTSGWAQPVEGVSITHIPTGISVMCHTHCSGHANKARCIEMLQEEFNKLTEWPEDTSDYGSRIAVAGQNGNDGQHYEGAPE